MAVVLAGSLASCTGWPRGWAQAKAGRGIPSDGVSGAWLGAWESGRSGHQGKLRCAVFPTKDGRWEYRYRATWAGFLCAGFTVKCEVTPDGPGQWKVRGEKDLGPVFGGVFTHTATVTGDRLSAKYSAKMDQGVMELRRVDVARDATTRR